MTDVFCPTSSAASSKRYHTDAENCRPAQEMLKNNRGRWVEEQRLIDWGWEECSRCAGTNRNPGSNGTQLADKLKAMGEERYPDKGDA